MTSTVFPMLIRSIGRVDSNCIVHLGELSVKAFWFNWTSVLWMPLECKTCLTIFSNNKRGFLRGVAVTACNHFSEIFAFRDVISVEMGWIYLWGLPISVFIGTYLPVMTIVWSHFEQNMLFYVSVQHHTKQICSAM